MITQKSINITHNIQFLHDNTFNYIFGYFNYSYIFEIIVSFFFQFLCSYTIVREISALN